MNDHADKFLSAMTSEGAINEEKISNENLDTLFSDLIKQVQDSLHRQGVVLGGIQDTNTRFTNAKTGNVSAQAREETLRKLASAFDTYMELTANLKEGTKFYNDLTQLLVRFQSKVTDFCFARKTEKEELLRDLTTAAANQPSGPAPAAPAYQKVLPNSSLKPKELARHLKTEHNLDIGDMDPEYFHRKLRELVAQKDPVKKLLQTEKGRL